MVVANGGVLFLEDIGDIGAPGGGQDWGLRINGTRAIYYGGEGQVDLQLDGAGNATLSGATPSLTAALSVPSQLDLVSQRADLSCGFVVKTLPGASSFAFSTGNNAVDITVLVHSPLQGVAVDGVGFDIQRSDGLAINATTPSSDQLVLNALDGRLLFMHKKMGGAFTWTVNVGNSWAVPCNIVVVIGSDSPQQDGQFYLGLPAATSAQIAGLGIFPPLPQGMQPQWFWNNFGCTICQARYYIVIGMFALTLPEVFATVTYRRVTGWIATAEIISKVVTVLKSLLQVDDGVANTIANLIINATDPLTWPKIICDATGEC
jgi:hypothetical protein